MRPFIISTDTTCDWPKSYLDERGIQIHPLHYVIDGVEYGQELENEEPSAKEFYDMLRDGKMPTTNATNLDYDIRLFENAVQKGYDIIHIAFSSAMSASCSNANLAAQEVMEKYPDARIEVIDSLSGSGGTGLLVEGAWKRLQDGKSYDEVLEWTKDAVSRIRVYFSVSDLFSLYRGGRLKKSSAILGTALKIQPMLYIAADGTLQVMGKVRGRQNALNGLVAKLSEAKEKGMLPSKVVVAHGDTEDEAKYVAEKVSMDYGIDDAPLVMISPTLGTHTGQGIIIFSYIEGE